jgi:radical SAM protein with 4Fe4S-binding SPASM domain
VIDREPTSAGGDAMISLPGDSQLLPLRSGALLVSRARATFCRVPPAETRAVDDVLRGAAASAALTPALRADLRRHGFFGPPRSAEPGQPAVQLQLTNDCNLACAYCCTNSGRPRERELDLATAARIVREIPAAFGPDTRVGLLGGEPLLVPWALDLAEVVLAERLHLTIFTNGTRLADPELARRVASLSRRGAEIRVSLAGPTAALCDSESKAPRFDAAVRGLQQLARFGGRASVDLMLPPHQVDAVVAHLRELLARLPPATPVRVGLMYLSGRETGQRVFRSSDALESALDRIAFGAGVRIPAAERAPRVPQRDGCDCALGRHLHVRSDGALFGCFKMEEKVGSLASEGFLEAARRLRASPHRARDQHPCAGCPLVGICGGGCRSENLLYTGRPDAPPCDTWRVRTLSELLAEDRVSAVEWPVEHLLAEAHRRGIDAPLRLEPVTRSRHLVDTR